MLTHQSHRVLPNPPLNFDPKGETPSLPSEIER